MNWQQRQEEGQQPTLFPEFTPQQQAVIDHIRQKGEAQINTLTAMGIIGQYHPPLANHVGGVTAMFRRVEQINTLTAVLGIPVGQLMALLVEMEFNGVLLSLPGARYRLA